MLVPPSFITSARRASFVLASVSLGAALAAGCARTTEGDRILDDLRRDGLLAGSPGTSGTPQPVETGAGPAPDALVSGAPIPLDVLLDAADRLNPALAAASAQVGAAGGAAWQAGLHPNPSVELEVENVRLRDGGLGASETTISFAQPIPLGDRRRLAAGEGAARVDEARWALERVRRDVHGRVHAEAAEIVSLRESIALHADLLDLVRRTLGVAETRFAARAAPESDAIRSRVEVTRLELERDRLGAELAGAIARLEGLLGGARVDADRIELDPAALAAEPPPPAPGVLDAALDAHPAVRAAESRVAAAERLVELERARVTPDLTARVGWGFDHGDDEHFLEAGVGLPLPLFDGNEGAILAARFDAMRARHERAEARATLRSSAVEAGARLRSAVRRLRVLEAEFLTDAQRSHDQTAEGYRAGRLDFLDLLDAQRTLVEASLARVEALRAARLALAHVRALFGADSTFIPTSGDPP